MSMRRHLIRTCVAAFLSLTLVLTATACGGSTPKPTASPTPTPAATMSPTPAPAVTTPKATATPDQANSLVEIVVPYIMYEFQSIEEIYDSLSYDGIEITQREDGDFVFKMTEAKRQEILASYEPEFAAVIKEMMDGGMYPEIIKVEHNDDFSTLDVYIDTEISGESIMLFFALMIFGKIAPMYQVYQGKGQDAISIISLIDASTNEVVTTYTAPDELSVGEMFNIGGETENDNGEITADINTVNTADATDGGAAMAAMKQAVWDQGYQTEDDFFYWGYDDKPDPVRGFKIIYIANGRYEEISILEFANEAAAGEYMDYPMFSTSKEQIIRGRFYTEISESNDIFSNEEVAALVEWLFDLAMEYQTENQRRELTLAALMQTVDDAGYEILEDYSNFGKTTPVDGFRFVYEDDHVYSFIDILEFEDEAKAQGYPMGGLFEGDHEYVFVGKFLAEVRAGDEDFPNDMELAVVDWLFNTAAGNTSDEYGEDPPTGGVEMLSAGEVDGFKAEIETLFQAPPTGGEKVSYEELAKVMPFVADLIGGDTKYERFLNADYTLENGQWVPYREHYIYEVWRKGDDRIRSERLCVFSYFHPDLEGDTECELIVESDGGYDCYNWMKSSSNGTKEFCDSLDNRMQGYERISIWDLSGAEFLLFPNQEIFIDGHPCQLFGMEYEGWFVYVWYATDLKRVLADEFVNDDLLKFTYYYINVYVNRDDAFFATPENVEFK